VVRVKQLTEKPKREDAASDLAVLGRYVIEPEIFDILASTRPGAGGEIQLTDALNTLASQKPLWAYSFEGRRYDVGDRLGFLEATIEYALRREDLAPALKAYLHNLNSKGNGF
jgi:UTP--glucose-1-phosphate uridylyltransferase